MTTTKPPARFKTFVFLLTVTLIPVYLLFQTKIQAYYYLKANCREQCKSEWDDFAVWTPPGFTTFGIDISHHSCHIDWDEVRKMQINGVGVQFAYMRATKGYDVDFLFAENWENARTAGMMRGAYHYFKPLLEPELQAQKFLHSFKLQPGDLAPVLDVEEGKGLDDAFVIAGIDRFLAVLYDQTGVRPMIYTNQYYYKKYIAGRFLQYPVWIAAYGVQHVQLSDRRNWRFWQFSELARANGVCEKIDLNVFAGNYQQLLGVTVK